MSSLWTPGGEVPVDRDRPPQETPPAAPSGAPGPGGSGSDGGLHGTTEDELRAQYEEMQRQVLEAPAADVVAQHAAALYELAAMHLSQERPRLADVRLVIDALTALVEGLQGRLGAAEEPLAAALPQLKMAYVEAVDRAGPTRPGA
jgi:hypothetical protein